MTRLHYVHLLLCQCALHNDLVKHTPRTFDARFALMTHLCTQYFALDIPPLMACLLVYILLLLQFTNSLLCCLRLQYFLFKSMATASLSLGRNLSTTSVLQSIFFKLFYNCITSISYFFCYSCHWLMWFQYGFVLKLPIATLPITHALFTMHLLNTSTLLLWDSNQLNANPSITMHHYST